jgi:UDP-N-acetylmuramoyl-tripeptide--D-alanyl-D-alanine ligase
LDEESRVHLGFGANVPEAIRMAFLNRPRGAGIWVQEISGHEPRAMESSLAFVRPTIGVVTVIGTDHISTYKSIEQIASAKGRIVEVLPPDGIAVLNADDPLVAPMADRTGARVLTFGTGARADIRLVSCGNAYPERLTMRVRVGDDVVDVATRFIGKRWTTSVLAAIAVAHAAGIPIGHAVERIGTVEPELFKDDVHVHAGITFMLDTAKAPVWTMPSSFEILSSAKAPRKIMLIGTLSDYRGSQRPKYTAAAKAALEVAQIVIFYGSQAQRVRRLKPEFPERLFMLDTFEALMAFLNTALREGDLVYVKASGRDHLERVMYEFERPVACRTTYCGRHCTCNDCKYLYSTKRRVSRNFSNG